MPITFKKPADSRFDPRILIVGVGGAGGNTVQNMMHAGFDGVEFLVAKTLAPRDGEGLGPQRIQMGASVTGGFGAGAKPEIGRAAAQASLDEIVCHLDSYHLVFVTAGMGRGTGSGAAPVIAQAAKEKGILTVGVLTKPFQFEGSRRMRTAETTIKEFQEKADATVVVSNQSLFQLVDKDVGLRDAFSMADEVIENGVRGIVDLIKNPGLINLDFEDVQTILADAGQCMMGTGLASGDQRAVEAAGSAISNPLLDEVSLKDTTRLLINVTGGMDLCLFEVNEAASFIGSKVNPDARIIFGSTIRTDMENNQVEVTVIASGDNDTCEIDRANVTNDVTHFETAAKDTHQESNRSGTEPPKSLGRVGQSHRSPGELSTGVDHSLFEQIQAKKAAGGETQHRLPRRKLDSFEHVSQHASAQTETSARTCEPVEAATKPVGHKLFSSPEWQKEVNIPAFLREQR